MSVDAINEHSRLNHKLVIAIKIIIAFFISLRLSLLPQDIFRDRINYLFSIANSEEMLFSLGEKGWFFLLHEPMAKIVHYILSLGFEGETILSLYAFINCFTVFLFLLLNRSKLLYSLLALITILITPYIFASTIGALQQGLGFSLILIGLIGRTKVISNKFAFILFLAALFHVIFYVFLGIIIFYRIIKKFTKSEVIPLFFVLGFIVLVGFLWGVITPYLNSTQSYEDFQQTTSGLTFIGWFFIFLIFFYNYLRLRKKNLNFYEGAYKFALFVFVCFLVFYWLAPGPYRILYSGMPLIVYSIFVNINKFSMLCLALILIYSLILHSTGAGAGSFNVTFGEFIHYVISPK